MDIQQTVQERLRQRIETLTRAERQLAYSMLENWPVSGLGSITSVASNADVSSATVARLVQKLDFDGFPAFQIALRNELEETISNPIDKHNRWSGSIPEEHKLNSFADAVLENLRHTLSHIDPADFDAACEKLADADRKIFVAGGRITHTLAEYLFLHLQMIRPDAVLVPSAANGWPHYLLDLAVGDLLIIFDIRRYQNDMLKLTEFAREKGAELIVFTDQWGSPVARHADHSFHARIEVPSAWDSNAAILVLLETMIAQVQSLTWDNTADRMHELEALFDRTRLFRKFK